MHAINKGYILVPYSLHKSFEMQFYSSVCSVCHVIYSCYTSQRSSSRMVRPTKALYKIMSHESILILPFHLLLSITSVCLLRSKLYIHFRATCASIRNFLHFYNQTSRDDIRKPSNSSLLNILLSSLRPTSSPIYPDIFHCILSCYLSCCETFTTNEMWNIHDEVISID
jgi:hypothetical protein